MIKIGKLRVDKGEKIGPTEFAKSVGFEGWRPIWKMIEQGPRIRGFKGSRIK